MTVGERIVKYRRDRGLSQYELSKIAGIPQSTLSSVEAGTRDGENLTLHTAKRLARALDITIDLLAGYRKRKNGHGTSYAEKTRKVRTSKTAA
jgi:transcriptional regulator with XRE-family HTH domain